MYQKQNFRINHTYLSKLNYNYLFSISSFKSSAIVDKYALLKLNKNGKIIAILY